MHTIGPNQNNVASLTIEEVVVDVVAGSARMDVADFNLRVPVKEGVGAAVLNVGFFDVIGEQVRCFFHGNLQIIG